MIAEVAKIWPGIHSFALLSAKENTPDRVQQLEQWKIRPIFFPAGKFSKIAEFLACLAEAISPSNAASAAPSVEPTVTLPDRRSLTSFVGREGEVAELHRLLSGSPLVTITGAAGCGKTRLALEMIPVVRRRFPDGVYFIPLDAIRDPQLVLAEIAGKLGVRGPVPASNPSGKTVDAQGPEGNTALLQAVQQRLGTNRVLLVLDNFEQVLDAAAIVAELLMTCSGLKTLVTSRQALSVQSEYEFALEPLFLPALDEPATVDALSRFSATKLFLERARSARPGFEAAGHEVDSVFAICRKLDGLPLAIELAAVKVRFYPVESTLSRLNEALEFLSQGPRDLAKRHQTMQAAIKWSYDLLPGAEQRLFRRLAVFAGGCNRDSVESVCDLDGDLGIDIEAGLIALAEKSLLRRQVTEQGPRYRMFEVIREFALNLFSPLTEAAAVYSRYTNYFLDAAQYTMRPLIGVSAPSSGIWLETEIGNLRTVLDRAVEDGDADTGLRLIVLMRPFWMEYGHASEGRQRLAPFLRMKTAAPIQTSLPPVFHPPTWFDKLKSWLGLEREPEADLVDLELELAPLSDDWLIEALQLSAMLAVGQGDHSEARSSLEELKGIVERSGDERLIESSVLPLQMMLSSGREAESMSAVYRDLLQRHTQGSDARAASRDLISLALLAERKQDFPAAKQLFEEASRALHRIGDNQGMAFVGVKLAEIEMAGSRPNSAVLYAQEGLLAARHSGNLTTLASVLTGVGGISAASGDKRAAAAEFQEALDASEKTGNQWLISAALGRLADLAMANEQPEQAKSYLERAEKIQQALGAKAMLGQTMLALDEIAVTQGLLPERARQAMAIFKGLVNRQGEARSLVVLGYGESYMANYEEALKKFQEARQIFDSLKDWNGAANTILRMAQVYRERGDYARSQEAYEEAMALYQEKKSEGGVANCLRLLGDLQRRQSNYEEARTSYQKSLEAYEKLKNRAAAASLLMALGDLSIDLKE
jgi:predicted ATPase